MLSDERPSHGTKRKHDTLFRSEPVGDSAGSQRKTPQSGGRHTCRPFQTERPAGYQSSAEQSKRREDAESSLRAESRDPREKDLRGDLERREVPVRLARRLV